MRTAKTVLSIILAMLLVACASHVIIAYLQILAVPYGSAPATVALLWLIPYGIAMIMCTVVIVVLNKKLQKTKEK